VSTLLMLHNLAVLSNRAVFHKNTWTDIDESLRKNIMVDITMKEVATFNRSLRAFASVTMLDFRGSKCEEDRSLSPTNKLILQVLTRHTYGVIFVDSKTNLVRCIGLKIKLLKPNERSRVVEVLHTVLGYKIKLESMSVKVLRRMPLLLFVIIYQTSLCTTGEENRSEKKIAKEIRMFGIVLIICSVLQRFPNNFLLCECNVLDEFRRTICQDQPLSLVEKCK